MGLDLTHVDENGKFFCFTYDYKPFQSALEKELIFVSFVPGSESALEQRLGLTVKEVTSILYAAKTSSELKVITQQEVQKLRQEREKPIWELNKAAARPVDPANISNAKYLQAGIDVVAVSTTA